MTVLECFTTKQPTQKEIDETPQHVRDYIRALEKTLINTLNLNYDKK